MKKLTLKNTLKAMKYINNDENDKAYALLEHSITHIVNILSFSFRIPGYETEDLKNEIIIAVFTDLKKIEYDKEKGSLESLIYRIAKIKLLNIRQSQLTEKRKTLNMSMPLESKDGVDYSCFLVAKNTVKDNSNLEFLLKMIKKIDFTKMELKIIDGLLKGWQYEQIAKHYKVNIKTVDNAKQRIMAKFMCYKNTHNIKDPSYLE